MNPPPGWWTVLAGTLLTIGALASRTAASDLVISNVRVFTGSDTLENATLLVDGDTITAVLPHAPLATLPPTGGGPPTPGGPLSGGPLTGGPAATAGRAGAKATPQATATTHIDGTGLTVLPGLIDAHVHLIAGTAGPSEAQNAAYVATQLPARLMAYLAHGVTTVKSLGDPTSLTIAVRRQIASGALTGPRLLTTGAVLTPVGGIPVDQFCFGEPWCLSEIVIQVADVAGAEARVDQLAAAGVDAIKFVNDAVGGAPLMPADVMAAIVARAHLHGLPVTGHASNFEADALAIAASGADGIEHMIATPLTGPALAQALLANDASYVTTLALREATLPPVNFADALANTAALHAAGVRIVLGTDTLASVPPGQTTLHELELLVLAGLTPAQALRAATRDAAEHLARRDLGRLEPGAKADLLLVAGNPLQDITAIHDIVAVFQGGQRVAP